MFVGYILSINLFIILFYYCYLFLLICYAHCCTSSQVRNKYVGTPPSRRYGHSATAIGPHIIIFGGWDGGKPLKDVIVLRDRSVAERAKEEDLNLR